MEVGFVMSEEQIKAIWPDCRIQESLHCTTVILRRETTESFSWNLIWAQQQLDAARPLGEVSYMSLTVNKSVALMSIMFKSGGEKC